jgi:DNA-binding transcriptional MerR regulator
VDPFTGYRQYTAAQLDRGNRLIALKELGFVLDQIGPVLDAQLSVAELRAMLMLRRAQVTEQIAADQARLAEIERRLRSIEGESMSQLEFVEKALPGVRVAQIVDSVADQPEIGPKIGPRCWLPRCARTIATRWDDLRHRCWMPWASSSWAAWRLRVHGGVIVLVVSLGRQTRPGLPVSPALKG